MLSKTLKKLRENCGYTQQQVADALSIERSTYTYYETGKTTPDINTIIKLSKIFNVSYIDIFEEEEKHPQHSFSDVAEYEHSNLKNLVHIYELSKLEKSLISLFRLLPIDEQKKLVLHLTEENQQIKKTKA